jgi:hypothetical protein
MKPLSIRTRASSGSLLVSTLAAAVLLTGPMPSMAAAPTISGPNPECFIAGEFPQLEALIVPGDKIVKVRIYFKSALSEAWFYCEVPSVNGQVVGALPKPNINAGPISYYFEALTADYTSVRSIGGSADVVADSAGCGDKKPAALAASGPTTIFGSGTPLGFAGVSVAAGAPIGAGAAAGGALLGTTTAIVAGGVVAGGITTGLIIDTNNDGDPPVTGTR